MGWKLLGPIPFPGQQDARLAPGPSLGGGSLHPWATQFITAWMPGAWALQVSDAGKDSWTLALSSAPNDPGQHLVVGRGTLRKQFLSFKSKAAESACRSLKAWFCRAY